MLKSIDLSIIVPIFNIKPYILQTLKSISDIANKINCEVIIQDALSTDGTSELIDNYCKKKPNWFHFREKDEGQSDAINKGTKKARGKWVTWLCGDDLLRKEFIELMKSKNIDRYDVVYGDVVFNNGQVRYPAIGTEDYKKFTLSKKRLIIQQPGTIIKRKWWHKVGGVNKSLNFHMDYDLFLRLEAKGAKFYRYPYFISEATIRPDAKTSSPSINRLLEYYKMFFFRHLRNIKSFAFRPYIVYSLEYILKNLEFYLYTKQNIIYRKLHSRLTKIFWRIADPVEQLMIEKRFRNESI